MKKENVTFSTGGQVVLLFLCMAMFSAGGFAQSGKSKRVKNAPVFSQVVYQGNDKVYNENPLQAGGFYNPILQGCYPDPAITAAVDETVRYGRTEFTAALLDYKNRSFPEISSALALD